MKYFLLFLIMSFGLHASNCNNNKVIINFFNHLESSNKLDQFGDIVLYGRDLNSGKVLELTFQKSWGFSDTPNVLSEGSFTIKINKSFALSIETGDFIEGYQTHGKLRSSVYNNYLEWKPANDKTSVKFFYEDDASLTKVIYQNQIKSIKYEFYPTQNQSMKNAFYTE